MKTKLTLHSGEWGTKKLVAKYGARLLFVRYRYDEKSKKRYKTVELIEEIIDWQPQIPSPTEQTLVEIKVDWDEFELRRKIKARGGLWSTERKVWRLTYGIVLELGLEKRIVSSKR